ncbi:MAG: ABC transporter permease [Deinococcales bacterium]|nr:ABC transporter permease [Deinococcales bacterium]
MLIFIAKRVLGLGMILLALSVLVFLLVKTAPGDPIRIMLGETASAEQVAHLTRLYGLDRPLPEQYLLWLKQALQGDLGVSVRRQLPVADLIAERMGATIELGLASLLLSILLGVPLGVIAAVKRNTWLDAGTMVLALIGVAAPSFWVGLLLLSTIGLSVDWVPIFGRGPAFGPALLELVRGDARPLIDSLRYLLLPALALGTSMIAVITRITRSSMLEVLGADFVRTARAKGVRPTMVVVGHALRNSLMPVVTVIGVQFGALLGGAIVIENVFAWPGVGRLIVQAITQRDFPLVQGSVLMLGAVFVIANLLVDLSYGLLDPRIRHE